MSGGHGKLSPGTCAEWFRSSGGAATFVVSTRRSPHELYRRIHHCSAKGEQTGVHLECWGDDVKDGKLTDFRRAVQAREDEAVVFSWIEWPNKATRDAAMAKVMNDPRLNSKSNPMPFDGKRMIFGGFAPVLELGPGT